MCGKSYIPQTLTRPAQNQEMVRVQLTLKVVSSQKTQSAVQSPPHSSNFACTQDCSYWHLHSLTTSIYRISRTLWGYCSPPPERLPLFPQRGTWGRKLPTRQAPPAQFSCPGPCVWPLILSIPRCPDLSSSQLPRAPALRGTRARKGHSLWLSLGSKNILSFLEFPSPPRLCGRNSDWYPMFLPEDPGKTRCEQACHNTEPPSARVSYRATLGGWLSMHTQVISIPEHHQKLPWQARPWVRVTDEIVSQRLLDLLTPAGSPGLGPKHISFTGDSVLQEWLLWMTPVQLGAFKWTDKWMSKWPGFRESDADTDNLKGKLISGTAFWLCNKLCMKCSGRNASLAVQPTVRLA